MPRKRRPEPLAPEPEARIQRPPDMPPPAGDREAELAAYLTDRFLRTYKHPFWARFRKQAKEDHEFRTGTGQWDAAQKARLKSKEKAVLTINQIRPVVEIIKGYEAAAPLEAKPIPVGKEDLEQVLVFERLFKHASARAETSYECSTGFDDGIVGGLGAWYVGVDYSRDHIYGEPQLERIEWENFCYDPGSRRYDLSDAREVFWYKTVAVDDLKAQYHQKADEIEAAIYALPVPSEKEVGGIFDSLDLPARDPRDGYDTPLTEGLQLYDPAAREAVVVEAWYRIWVWDHVMIDKRMERATVIPLESLALARELAKIDPLVKIVERPRREFSMCVFLPATKTFLAGGQSFENDREAHPFVQFLAYREGDEILGMVRNLKDSQRDVNKRRSALADAAGRAGRYKYYAHRASLENPEALEDDTADVYYFRRPDLAGVKEVSPPAWPEWLWRLDEKAGAEIRETSLINAPMQGQATGQSGVALAHLKQQGQIGTASLFRNYRRSRHLLARRFGRRVQQCYSTEKTIRLDAGAGQVEWVTINQHTVAEDGTMQVVNDVPSLQWDVEMVDSPLTPTARMAHLVMLLEVVSKLPPEYAEAMADIFVEWTDVPNREEVVERVKAIQARKGLGAQGANPALPGNGGQPRPSGVTPGLVNRAMGGAPLIAEGPLNLPIADNLRAAGVEAGAV